MVQPTRSLPTPHVQSSLIDDSKQPRGPTPASGWGICMATLKFATRAAFAQGAAFVIQGGIRSAFQEAYHASRGTDEYTADVGILAIATIGTFIFDQTCIHKAVSSVYEWVATKCNGGDVPAQPLSATGRHLVSLAPTALSVALLAREAYGDNASEPMLLAYDLAGMMLGWRLGRLTRDTIQQGTTGAMPKLKIVDVDTGEELTGQQKRTFDDTRLGWQMAMYTATMFINAFVTVPEGLRGVLGPARNERSPVMALRHYAMLAPAIGSMLVEAADEVYSVLAQVVVASRQDAVMEISHDAKTPGNWGELAVHHGAMRALMGTFVTDLAQHFIAVDRDMDQWSALGTAIGSVASSIMDIRAKSVGVTKKYRTAAREFQNIVNRLARAAQDIHFQREGRRFTPEEQKRMKAEIRKVARAFSKAGWGSMTVDRVTAMSSRELGAAARAMDGNQTFEDVARAQGIPLQSSRDEKARISGLRQRAMDTPLDELSRLLRHEQDQLPYLTLQDKRLAQARKTMEVAVEVPAGAQPAVGAREFKTMGVPPGSHVELTEGAPLHIHPSPIKVPHPVAPQRDDKYPIPDPASPRKVQARDGAQKPVYPVCHVVDEDAQGNLDFDRLIPGTSRVSVSLNDGRAISAVFVEKAPQPGYIHVRPDRYDEGSPFGEYVQSIRLIEQVLRIRVASGDAV